MMVATEAIFAAEFKEMPTTAIMDGGATSFVAGSQTVGKYVAQLKTLQYPIDDIKIYSCNKTFRFGNDKTEDSLPCIMLPVFFGHKYGEICCYIVPWGTPFLLAWPIMEQLQLTLDSGHQRACWQGGEWFQVKEPHWSPCRRLAGGVWEDLPSKKATGLCVGSRRL
jgi:hypothetical protein